ncbi:hypothetical protein FN846DRAFT_915260 [Sphaerosporella brunnea]|uniref:Uncharacterized protein n=1 Tax=Sphaerosporella brunnea TaxID=1250544 RepID=A0A5J5EC21_9PEZI|nr:hypothetical protein FN846DRAFT_915260 [Sphaerosporella brunnea]
MGRARDQEKLFRSLFTAGSVNPPFSIIALLAAVQYILERRYLRERPLVPKSPAQVSRHE